MPSVPPTSSISSIRQRWSLWVDGAELSAKAFLEVANPSNGEILAEVARAGAQEVHRAVVSATEALPCWSALPSARRVDLLLELGRRLAEPEVVEELGLLECLNTGKPLREARDDVVKTAAAFTFYAGLVDKLFGTTIPVAPDVLNYTVREPMGVTAHIAPWNYPLRLAFRSIVPALAGGNTVVLKPAEETPLSALRAAEMLTLWGLPKGVLNVVPGLGPEAGAALAGHPGIAHISFTGSVETGREVMRQAARNVVPVTLELGGKSPNIVLADADQDLAADFAVKAAFSNAGQVCFAATRLLVQDSIYETFLERCRTRALGWKVGPGLDDPDMGPLITPAQKQRVQEYLELGLSQGARLLCGGGVPEGLEKGNFLQPTVLDGLPSDSRLCQEEIFGPVLVALPFDTLEQAIRLANDSDYGLAAGVWTSNLNSAHRLAAALKVGQVFVNDYFSSSLATPFGGMKRSGFGRERGVEAMSHYTQVKSVFVRLRQ